MALDDCPTPILAADAGVAVAVQLFDEIGSDAAVAWAFHLGLTSRPRRR
jgi:hypothetical protein